MSGKKYTVAEQGPRIEEFLKKIFALAGFSLKFVVSEGETPHPDFENPDLLVRFSGSDVDLLFTDIQMPGKLDGMDLARQVHARWPNVLLVITSGQKKPPDEEIPDHGRFVAKPYRAEELLGQVDDMIHKGNSI